MIATILVSAAMGYCGTPYPGWFGKYLRKKRPTPPPPEPWGEWLNKVAGPGEPVPWRLVIGAVGGIAGGLAAQAAFGPEQFAAIGLAAFAGGRLAFEAVDAIRG